MERRDRQDRRARPLVSSAAPASGPDPASVIETDALVIGAGPVGLFQVFELGLLDIRAHVVDSLPYAGGQCVELYADKPIYDIPSVAVCTGQELADRLLAQVAPFEPRFHFSQVVTGLQQQPDSRFSVQTSRGTRFLAKTVFIAAGVGAFQPKQLRVEGLDAYENSQLFYHPSDTAAFAGRHLVIVGGDEEAVSCALAFAEPGATAAASVTLIHRRDEFKADAARLGQLAAQRDNGSIRFLAGQITGFDEIDNKLAAVKVTDPDDAIHTIATDALLVYLGLSPKLGPVTGWGLDIERKQLKVDTERFSTSVPGIFAVGDINTYPGKRKLIVSGFHECVLAAFGAAAIVFPDQPIHLQYTTTSPKLHRLLGVTPASADAQGG
ncbi:MAG: NAD(P)/FAD-dependent oxidoreductase [Burkholderiales bacterium]|nr:MAG: NAD(P)/FAD-dependent oxidoreductase [Burkholderiales bacterium]